MIIVVHQEVWEPPAGDHMKLVALCGACRRRGHTLVTHPAWDEEDDDQLVTRWLRRHGWRREATSPLTEEIADTLREGLETFGSRDQSRTPRLRVTTSETDWAAGRLSLDAALQIADAPLQALVESDDADVAFLKRMAYPHHRRTLEAACERGALRFEHAGGIDRIIGRLEDLKDPTTDAQWAKKLRLWVMFDADADPRDCRRPSPRSRAACDLLKEHRRKDSLKAPWPVLGRQLERRAIENYVPVETIKRWWARREASGRDSSQKAEAYASLLERVRFRLRLKPPKRGPISKADFECLGIEGRRTRRLLCRGLRGLADAWSDPHAISDGQLRQDGSDSARTVLKKERLALLASLLRGL